jgi:hypothetical protein
VDENNQSCKSWRLLFQDETGPSSIIVDAPDRRSAREIFLAQNKKIKPDDVKRVVLVPG